MRTRVGYTGGSAPEPTYHRLGDHTESFQLDYDPARISYETLLGHFWKEADPTERPYSRQYMSAVFYADETQKRLALATGRQAMAGRSGPMLLPILPLATFHRAEDYHQKYYLRRYTDLMREFSAYSERELEDSTVAMWLNACVGGELKREALEAELGRLGLSEAEHQRLLRLARMALAHRRR
ncbi:peptide methionine sulfoxide reductase [Vitiosangium sp. GDMCC 1.1324]|nr:peptide methionine sulfoxide reductase [Vitiosangium sp. GDMCC 1.1324]